MSAKGLSKQVIVNQAIKYIAETEKSEISLREVARRLGVKAPSLYNHIKNTEELQYAVYQHAIDLFVQNQQAATSGKTQDDAIKVFAEAYHTFAIENKGLYQVIMSIPSEEDETGKEIALPLLKTVVFILSDYGLPEESIAHWQRVFRAILHGFVSQEYLGYFYFYRDVDLKKSRDIALQCFLDGLHAEKKNGT